MFAQEWGEDMKISELIKKLEELKEQHGDLPVRHTDSHYYMDIYQDSFEVAPLQLEKHLQGHPNEKMILISGC